MSLDIGGAIAQGITGLVKGNELGYDRKAKQQALTQQAEMFPIKKSQLEEQVTLLQQQNKVMADSLTKQGMYRAFDSGTLTDLNHLVKSDKNLQTLFPGLQSMREINDRTELNYAQGMEHPVVATSIVQGPNGPEIQEKVVDLDYYKTASGYSLYSKKRDEELLKSGTNTEKMGILQQARKDAEASPDKSSEIMFGALEKTNPELFLPHQGRRRDALQQFETSLLVAGIRIW